MTHNRSISVTGLGYVGLQVAVAFARSGAPVIAYDISANRVQELSQGIDRSGEVAASELLLPSLEYTCDPAKLRVANFHIVAVPTPITAALKPDLSPLLAATRTLGQQIKRGDIAVFESTVYPGATEEDCVPVLERESGLRCGQDFNVGYSPERINPGDKNHRFETIAKVISAQNRQTLEVLQEVYGSVVIAGVHIAPDIPTAEAAKAIENTQRDLNIALMNELAMICSRLGIDTRDVLAAAGSKWNFLPFYPGLVGGHCVGVDPYYLTDRAERAGYYPEVILAGRRINAGMGRWIARETIKRLLCRGDGTSRTVTVLGLTFKEDVPDFRNTRVADVVEELQAFGADVRVCDPYANDDDTDWEFPFRTVALEAVPPADAVIVAVPHRIYRDAGWPLIRRLLKGERGIVTDVRACLDRTGVPAGIQLWRP